MTEQMMALYDDQNGACDLGDFDTSAGPHAMTRVGYWDRNGRMIVDDTVARRLHADRVALVASVAWQIAKDMAVPSAVAFAAAKKYILDNAVLD